MPRHTNRESELLPMTGMSLGEARSKLSGLHFSKEALTEGEREILYVAEALLRLIDADGEGAENSVEIVLPAPSTDKIRADLRYLTKIRADLRYLTQALHEAGLADGEQGGVFGGDFGYGANFENDAFVLHRYCWCERDDCPWCLSCTCPDEAVIYHRADGRPLGEDEDFYALPDSERGEVVTVPEHQCAYCKGDAKPEPNFRHKASGSTVTWYKYIGRGMDTRISADWGQIMAECLSSLGKGAKTDG